MDSELKACFDKWEASFDALCRYLHDTATGATGPVTASSATNESAITSEGMAPASSSSSASPALSTTWENVSPAAPTSCVKPCSRECATQAMSTTSDFLFADNRVTAPMTSSSDTADLTLASARLAESAAPVPGIGEPLAVAPVVPIHTIAGLPASCSTDCAAQTITMSPSTLLPWVARSSTPASKSNGMVSTESIPDNEADEHGTSFDNGTVDVMPVLAAADGVTLDAAAAAFCSWDCTAEVVSAPSTTPTSTTSPLLWASVISTKLCPENDDAEHGPLLTVAPARSSELAVPTMLSTSSTTEVGGVLPAAPVCIPWASTKPWLEPVPPHPPDLWSLFLGAWSFSRPPDSLGCTGGLLSPLRPCLPAPAPKPQWPLLGLEKLTGNGHPAFVIVSVHLLSEAKLATIVFPRESRIRAVSADVQQWLLLTGIIGEWSCLIGSVKKKAPAVTYYGREELGLVNLYDSVVMLVELRPWIYSIVMNFFELACLQNGQENSDLLQLLGTLSSSVSCGMAKDQCNARAKWSFSDLLLRVHEWAPTIQSVQHACVTSALSLHERYTNGILVQELVNCSVLTLFSSASLYSFWVPDLLEGANKLKCTKTAQGLTGEHLVEAALSQEMRVCCLLGSLYQEEHGSSCNKLLSEAKLTDTIGGLFMDHHSRYNSFSPGTYFGVEWLNGILLQDYLLFQFIGHVIQCGFELLQWKIAWLRQLQCSEITSADLKENVLPDVDEEIIEANLMVVSYWAASVVAWSVFCTILKSTEANTATNTPDRVIMYMHEVPVIIDSEYWCQIDKTFRLVWSSKLMKLVRGSEQGSNSSVSSPVLLSVWQHVNYTQWLWDPGGSMFAVCRSQQWWPNPERLHCPEELEWSFVLSARAFWIWLVAWDVDDLEFSADGGQGTFQGWMIAIRVTFSDHIQTSQDHYIAFVNQIPVSYNYSLHQTYYCDTVCIDMIYFREYYHGDSNMTKELHMPWDPGKSVLWYNPKLRLGDKPSFKEGGMLGPLSDHPLVGLSTWAHHEGLGPYHSQLWMDTYNYPGDLTNRHPSWITNRRRRHSLSPTSTLFLPSPFHAVHIVSRLSTKFL